jgi:COP9 signalosome complex subunit 1
LIEQGQYAHIATYVYKADTALDALASAAAKDGKKVGADTRERHQSRLEFASGLSRLGQGHYERAAGHFLKVGPREHLEGWAGSVCPHSHVKAAAADARTS